MTSSQGPAGTTRRNQGHPSSRLRIRTLAVAASAALFVAGIGPVAAIDVAPPGTAAANAALYATPDTGPGWSVRSFPVAPGLVDVAGLTYDAASGNLLVTGVTADGARAFAGVSLGERPTDDAPIDGAFGPVTDISQDSLSDTVTISSVTPGELLVVPSAAVRSGAPGTPAPHPVGQLNGVEFASITTDPATGDLFGLVAGTTEVLRVFGGDPADRKGTPVASITLAGAPDTLSSIAFNASDGYLYLTGPSERLFVYDTDGNLIDDEPLTDSGIVSPTAMAFAPSGDRTDDPSDTSLYVLDDRSTVTGTTEIVEVSFEIAATPMATTDLGSLVNTTLTSVWSPPSPDPAGITFLPASGRLLVADSEVNEMPIYTGFNLFETTTAGSLTDTADTTAYSNEPTGLSFNATAGYPSTGHLFSSDDDRDEIYELAPGPDGILHTPDDVVTSFDTNGFGSDDPEGVEFDPVTGHIFIVDGLGKEIYRVDPGPNGLFDGSDDIVTHFDVEAMGIGDPEGLGIDADRGVLVVGDRPTNSVIEVTPGGLHIRTIDLTSASPDHIASATMAPGSVTPTDLNLYITTRGVDNNTDPNENDGVMLEFSVPTNTTNVPPAVGAGYDQSVIYPAAATLDGKAVDDDLPNPPATLTTTWSKSSGPGTVTFGDAGSAETTATFSTPGTYVLQLEASDSTLSASDTITIEVDDPAGPFTVVASIAVGTDDAEEQVSNGNMFLTSADLDLTTDDAVTAATFMVGLRYALDVPAGATITNATIQFRSDAATSGTTNLAIQAHADDNAPTFVDVTDDLSARPVTTASVAWSPPEWSAAFLSGPDQQTSNVALVVQEIVDRPGWAQGNAIAFVITGTGDRVADSTEGNYGPVLTVEYLAPVGSPTVAIVATDPSADETGADPGEFTVSRTGSTAAPLVVNYVASGTATPVDDYVALTGSVEIPATQVSATVTVTPVDDGDTEPEETVILTLSADAAYMVGSPDTDTVTIAASDPDTTPPVITLLGDNPQTIIQNDPYVELGATAVDDVDGDLTSSIVIDASAVDTSTVGSYPVTYDVSDVAGNPATQEIRTVDVKAPLTAYTVDFSAQTVLPYGVSQDVDSTFSVEDAGASLRVTGNGWKKIGLPTLVKSETVLEFDYSSSVEGEIHGIGFDTDDNLSPDRTFGVFGTQTWGLQDYRTYVSPTVTHFTIPVGHFYTGVFDYLFFVNDDDRAAVADGVFTNVVVSTPPPPPPPSPPTGAIDFSTHTVESYGGSQDAGSAAVSGSGYSLELSGDAWKKIKLPTVVQSGTVLEFDYSSSVEGEIHGIGFTPNNNLSQDRTFEVFGTQTWGLQAYATYVAPGWTHYTIPVGTFHTGTFDYLFFVNDDDASGIAEGTFANVVITSPPPPPGAIDFSTYTLESYGGSQDAGSSDVLGDGASLRLSGNAWKKIAIRPLLKHDSVLEFDYSSSVRGEIHGIGFDTDDVISPDVTFQLFGTQIWGIQDYATYASPTVTHYTIPIGLFYTGRAEYLFFVNDHDSAGIANGTFTNVVITTP